MTLAQAQALKEPIKLTALFSGAARYRVARGGRGGAKSWGFARRLVLRALQTGVRALCAREYQASIDDSVKRLLVDQIEALGVAHMFDVQKRVIYGPNNSVFLFEGLSRNITKIKSMEGIDVCWVEEAEKVSDASWEVLIPTIRKPGSEIWISFNPAEETDPTYKRFVLNTPPGTRRVEISWRDNPWFPDELRREMEYLRLVDHDAYLHVWEGQCRTRSAAQVLNGKWRIDGFSEADLVGCDGPYYGIDWGYSVDPMAAVRMAVKDRKLYITHEVGGVGIELDDIAGKLKLLPGADTRILRADNARPETISHVARKGNLKVIAADKWPGSVEDGIAFLRGFEEIVIHDRCRQTATEARLWSYKTDRLTGDVLPDLLDKNNHYWDASRYGLAPLIRRRDPAHVAPNFHMGR